MIIVLLWWLMVVEWVFVLSVLLEMFVFVVVDRFRVRVRDVVESWFRCIICFFCSIGGGF